VISNFPCKTCGHNKEFHYEQIDEEWGNLCTLCKYNWDTRDECEHDFIPDNLKYLESLSAK